LKAKTTLATLALGVVLAFQSPAQVFYHRAISRSSDIYFRPSALTLKGNFISNANGFDAFANYSRKDGDFKSGIAGGINQSWTSAGLPTNNKFVQIGTGMEISKGYTANFEIRGDRLDKSTTNGAQTSYVWEAGGFLVSPNGTIFTVARNPEDAKRRQLEICAEVRPGGGFAIAAKEFVNFQRQNQLFIGAGQYVKGVLPNEGILVLEADAEVHSPAKVQPKFLERLRLGIAAYFENFRVYLASIKPGMSGNKTEVKVDIKL